MFRIIIVGSLVLFLGNGCYSLIPEEERIPVRKEPEKPWWWSKPYNVVELTEEEIKEKAEVDRSFKQSVKILKNVAAENIGKTWGGDFRAFFNSHFKLLVRDQFETVDEFSKRWVQAPTDTYYFTKFVNIHQAYVIEREEFIFESFPKPEPEMVWSAGLQSGLGVRKKADFWDGAQEIKVPAVKHGIIIDKYPYGFASHHLYGVSFTNMDSFWGSSKSLIKADPVVRISPSTLRVTRNPFSGRIISSDGHPHLFAIKTPRDEARKTLLKATFGFRFISDWTISEYPVGKDDNPFPSNDYSYVNAQLTSLVVYDDITKKVYVNLVYFRPEDVVSSGVQNSVDSVRDLIKRNLANIRSSDKAVKQAGLAFFRQVDSTYTPAIQTLTTALADESQVVRAVAAYALGKIGPAAKSAVPKLKALLEDPYPGTQKYAKQALDKIETEQ